MAFPGVWHNWQNLRPEGGFDAVIGNPPWDRIKLQEVEWFATRAPELALARPQRRGDKAGVQRLRDSQGSSLVPEFDAAKARSESLSRMVRSCGDYPLLSGGDINLYSLFVERAMGLIKAGWFGWPAGAVRHLRRQDGRPLLQVRFQQADVWAACLILRTAAIGTGLPPFFPDVDSRFKFCALIFGGEERLFDQTECAFFLDDTKTIHDEERCFPLTPADFAGREPQHRHGTGVSHRRDADITRRIYERHPVLVERSGGTRHRAWPVKYMTMFHMTNDSHLFHTAPQLETEGFYPVAGNRWKRETRNCICRCMRARWCRHTTTELPVCSVNPKNLNRPAQPREATSEEHANPDWLPDPPSFGSEQVRSIGLGKKLEWVFGFKTK